MDPKRDIGAVWQRRDNDDEYGWIDHKNEPRQWDTKDITETTPSLTVEPTRIQSKDTGA